MTFRDLGQLRPYEITIAENNQETHMDSLCTVLSIMKEEYPNQN